MNDILPQAFRKFCHNSNFVACKYLTPFGQFNERLRKSSWTATIIKHALLNTHVALEPRSDLLTVHEI